MVLWFPGVVYICSFGFQHSCSCRNCENFALRMLLDTSLLWHLPHMDPKYLLGREEWPKERFRYKVQATTTCHNLEPNTGCNALISNQFSAVYLCRERTYKLSYLRTSPVCNLRVFTAIQPSISYELLINLHTNTSVSEIQLHRRSSNLSSNDDIPKPVRHVVFAQIHLLPFGEH